MNGRDRIAGFSRPLTLLAAVAIVATVADSEPLEVGLVEKAVVAVAQLEILATDADGAAVDDLRPAEIRVFEDGVEQKLAFLERVSAGRVRPRDSASDREPATLNSEIGEHPAGDAESHLRMKYKKGARYVDSSEDFIDRLASSSSWTGRPYHIRCPEEAEQTAAAWLHSMLRDYRRGPLAATPSL